MPIKFSSLFKRILWSIVSNAALRSSSSRLASQRRQSHSSLPILTFFTCLLLLSRLILLRDSLCSALQTEKLWIWSTGLSALLTPSFRLENWVPGNLSALTERSQLGIRGMRGRGGKSYVLRLFPWRTLKISTFSDTNDNRSSADWIRLCPGLSKNSENGYSCPKPHKTARHDWSSGKSGQHCDWDY